MSARIKGARKRRKKPGVGAPRAKRVPIRYYSGRLSEAFWKRVSALRDASDQEAVYALGVLLQETEGRVLGWLERAEAKQQFMGGAR